MTRWLIVLLAVGASAEPITQVNVRVAMRDGVRLSTNVFRPSAEGRYPVLLTRTPYGKAKELTPNLRYFLDHGYIVVSQDVRGRYQSEGLFRPIAQEMADGEDTIRWAARQLWSNGSVGMFGGSYVGITQWQAALAAPPELKAIVPVVAGADEYRDRYYSPGGAFKLGHRLQWLAENLRIPGFGLPEFHELIRHLPLRTADRAATGQRLDFYQDVMDHPAYDDWWRAVSTLENAGKVRAAAMIVGGWYDNYCESDWLMFEKLRAMGRPVRILTGPWGHNMSLPMPEVDFGPQSRIPLRQMEVEWFDRWMKGTPSSAPAVQYFAMGENAWRKSETWPPAGATTMALYLTQGQALSPNQSKKETRFEYQYDPRRPVPTRGGALCCNSRIFPWGPLDQRPVEARADLLSFTSSPVQEPTEVVGAVKALLYVASSAPDTDFTAKLTDVSPDGRSQLLCDGILRLRYRKSLSSPELLTPGSVAAILIPAGMTGHVFAPGHRIRLVVSSSNFPRFDRNPNTGKPVADERDLRIATQVILAGPRHPSHLRLPVIPRPQ